MPTRRITANARVLIDFETRAFQPDELTLRQVAVLDAKRIETFIRAMYFEGGDVLACTAGQFRFSFDDGSEVVLSSGEILLIYPQNVVTIESVVPRSSLNYVILTGTKVADYFDSFGFYDHLRFRADPQDASFQSLLRASQQPDSSVQNLLTVVCDLLRNFQQLYRQAVGPMTNEAIRVIHQNLAQGSSGIKPVCEALSVSRSFLNALFQRAGLESPGAFIRRQQTVLARRLIRNTNLPIAEIGKRVGISSPIYFSAFVRRFTGQTPTELRKS